MNKIPPTNKNKIITEEEKDDNNNNRDDDDDVDEIYNEEQRSDYSEATLVLLQKSLLEYVDRKNLTLCEYLSTDSISQYLGYS